MFMKRIKIYLLLLITSVMVSCNALELGPEDIYSINNYWNSPEQCDRFVRGLHWRMRDKCGTYFQMGEVRDGLFVLASTNSTGEGSSDIEAKNNTLSVANPGLSTWGKFYTDIYQVNHAIDKISTACAFFSDNDRNFYLGKLYGMRAYYYFHLLRTYGGVPLCDKPDVLMTSEISQLNKPRATEQEIWQFVRDDVDASCNYFANTTRKEDLVSDGQAYNYWNKAASICLQADVYLWGAKVKPLKGASVFSPTPEQDMIDAKEALSAIEPLYKPYDKFTDVFAIEKKVGNTEMIFAYRNKLAEAGTIFNMAIYNPNVFTKFFDAEGEPMSNPENIGSGAQKHEYTLDFYASLSDDDTRKAATLAQYYLKSPDGELYPAGTYFKKFLGSLENSRKQFDNDMPVYRYMDIALMLAEISNELNQTTEVKRWIEVVRKRAYGATNMPVFNYTSKEDAEEAILAERKAEFVGEFKGWYDIRRMLGGKYALQLVNDKELKLVWPIDAGVLSTDPLVKQNEGYL